MGVRNLCHHAARHAEHVRSVRPGRHDRLLEPRTAGAVPVRPLSRRAGLLRAGLGAARRAGAGGARAPRGLRVRRRLPGVRRAAEPAARRSSRTPTWSKGRDIPGKDAARALLRHWLEEGPMTPHDWPVAFFDDDYLRIYRAMISPAMTAAEVDFLAAALAPPPGGEVLDLACGYGRHAIGLARRGYRVTGRGLQRGLPRGRGARRGGGGRHGAVDAGRHARAALRARLRRGLLVLHLVRLLLGRGERAGAGRGGAGAAARRALPARRAEPRRDPHPPAAAGVEPARGRLAAHGGDLARPAPLAGAEPPDPRHAADAGRRSPRSPRCAPTPAPSWRRCARGTGWRCARCGAGRTAAPTRPRAGG